MVERKGVVATAMGKAFSEGEGGPGRKKKISSKKGDFSSFPNWKRGGEYLSKKSHLRRIGPIFGGERKERSKTPFFGYEKRGGNGTVFAKERGGFCRERSPRTSTSNRIPISSP